VIEGGVVVEGGGGVVEGGGGVVEIDSSSSAERSVRPHAANIPKPSIA
jgi:hypothetical protein